MRLLIQLKDQKQGYALSAYLTKRRIENQLEMIPNTDWGSSEYGQMACKLWIIDEDHFLEAEKIAKEFTKEPNEARFIQNEPVSIKPSKNTLASPLKTSNLSKANQREMISQEPMGKITLFLLIICSLLLFSKELSTPTYDKPIPEQLPMTPFYMPEVYKQLMFDYPYAYTILDKIIRVYGVESLKNTSELPSEGVFLLNEFNRTPYWKGFYQLFMNAHQNGSRLSDENAPLFEKIRQGEIWRLFTPCLLHADILHLIFNMMWLAVLGKQMEERLGKARYLLFILIVGILSNCAQYLMGGSNFLGFSGVLCGMLAFVWVRRKYAAWEGYQLQPGTLGFITFFILLMVAIQLFSFFAEYFWNFPIIPGIANTAHLSGAFIGYLLAKMKFYAWKIT